VQKRIRRDRSSSRLFSFVSPAHPAPYPYTCFFLQIMVLPRHFRLCLRASEMPVTRRVLPQRRRVCCCRCCCCCSGNVTEARIRGREDTRRDGERDAPKGGRERDARVVEAGRIAGSECKSTASDQSATRTTRNRKDSLFSFSWNFLPPRALSPHAGAFLIFSAF